MRALPSIVAVGGLVVIAGAIALVGRGLMAPQAESDPATEIRQASPQPQPVPATQPTVAERPGESAVVQPQGTAVAPPVSEEPATTSPQQPSVALRPIQPGVVAIPPVDPSTLERVDPRPPLSAPPADKPLRKPPDPLMHRPVAEAAGIVDAEQHRITIAGIEPVADAETCSKPDGSTWPCGRAARTAFRAFLRGRAITCDLPDGDVPEAFTARCKLGPRDIGAWLVANGWSRPGGDYAEEARLAREGKRGIWGDGPAGLPPRTDLPDAAPTAAVAVPADADTPEAISILPRQAETGSDVESGTGESEAGPAPSGSELSPLPPPSSPAQ